MHPDGSFERLEVLGSVLGMLPELGYEERRCSFEPGDLLVIFSDGVTEAETPAGVEYGDERLGQWLVTHRTSSAADLIEGILGEIDKFSEGAPAADDVTVLVARYLDAPRSPEEATLGDDDEAMTGTRARRLAIPSPPEMKMPAPGSRRDEHSYQEATGRTVPTLSSDTKSASHPVLLVILALAFLVLVYGVLVWSGVL